LTVAYATEFPVAVPPFVPEVMAVGSFVLSKVKMPIPPDGMALPVLFPNRMDWEDVAEVQPVGAFMLVGTEGRSKVSTIQPYQKALIGLLPVFVRIKV
jgi:hypothetical protein